MLFNDTSAQFRSFTVLVRSKETGTKETKIFVGKKEARKK